MANQVMRITLKAYDHKLVDASAKKNHRNSKEKRISGKWTGTSSY
jgi:ribosomal protein S10